MRVIAGDAKGRPLLGPAGPFTRPMQDKIKEALFSMLWSLDIDGTTVLDLYAGTGAIGIEAMSRWGATATFVDGNEAACNVVRRNLERTGFAGNAQVRRMNVERFIDLADHPFEVIFLDPPYADPGIEAILLKLAKSTLIQSGTVVAIGHWPKLDLPEEIGRLSQLRRRCHGDSCFSIYEADLPPAEGDDSAAPSRDLSG